MARPKKPTTEELQAKIEQLQQINNDNMAIICELRAEICNIQAGQDTISKKEFDYLLKQYEHLKLMYKMKDDILEKEKNRKRQNIHNERGAGRKKKEYHLAELEQVRQMRKIEKLTVAQIAEKIGKSVATVNRMIKHVNN